MSKPLILIAALAAAFSFSAATAAPVQPQRIEGRVAEALSFTGETLLVRSSKGELVESDMAVINSLKLRFPEYDLWEIQSAAGLALRSGDREDPVPLPAGSYAALTRARLSDDGRVLALAAGAGGRLDALRWQRGGQPERLVPEDRAWRSGVSDMSADGKTVTGWLLASEDSLPQGFIWTADKGFSLLPEPLSVPLAISADGRTVAGDHYRGTLQMLAQRDALMRFDAESGLGENEGVKHWETLAVSGDGRRVAGYVELARSRTWQGFVWDTEKGFVNPAKPPVLRHKGKGMPDLAAFGRRVLAAAGMSDADRVQFVQTDVVRWTADEGAKQIQPDAAFAGLSRDGRSLFLHPLDQKDRLPPLWQLDANGKHDLNQAVGSDTVYLTIRAVSPDGSRMWLNGSKGNADHILLVENGGLLAFTPAVASIEPQAFSRDAGTVAGFSRIEEPGYPSIRWRAGDASPRLMRCPGDEQDTSRHLISGDGKVIAAGQYDNGKNHICLFGPLP
ncbi:hypothetical protein [Paludibacterium paludis]|uniref:Uncharacterized protein n=1 Tax=Paludibacterium paludis TaxID=1225769 RepID=A0A918P0H2_9NEIS|nr:hypothetical protein [Paludibacterium paludis]GGY11867.1 hypothetical protein GCM10011289_13460 [Paludibacterium paludis]